MALNHIAFLLIGVVGALGFIFNFSLLSFPQMPLYSVFAFFLMFSLLFVFLLFVASHYLSLLGQVFGGLAHRLLCFLSGWIILSVISLYKFDMIFSSPWMWGGQLVLSVSLFFVGGQVYRHIAATVSLRGREARIFIPRAPINSLIDILPFHLLVVLILLVPLVQLFFWRGVTN